MCGILGFTGKKDLSLVQRLLHTIGHRGFDDYAIHFTHGLNYGMNRLAILDVTKGYYPFRYKQYELIYNGEIYNFKSIKNLLVKAGVKFRTNCDAEVILPLFERYGLKAFQMLEGMFAICILDTNLDLITLVRDKAGEKPLYYCSTDGFSFSSEMKTLLQSTSNRHLNTNQLSNYLHHGSVFGSETLVKDIFKLLPAHIAQFDIKNKSLTIKRYWSPTLYSHSEKKINSNDLTNELARLLEGAVQSRLLSDVPVGTFLSGGVDSSLITALATKQLPNLRTYSTSFPGFHEDESKYSRLVSQYLKTNHTEVECTAQSVKKIMEDIANVVDEPISDPAVLPTFLISKEARKNVKVILSGEGADELFGGYYRYQKAMMHSRLSDILLKTGLSKIIQSIPSKRVRNRLQLNSGEYSPQNIWTQDEIGLLLANDYFSSPIPARDSRQPYNSLLYLQLSDFSEYLPAQLLMKVDKITMQNNLEARAPFLDADLINFAFQLKSKYKIHGLHNKYLLRQVASQYLPPEIVWRLKHGFSVPLNEWFRAELKDFVLEMQKDVSELKNIFNPITSQRIISNHMEHKSENRDKIWSLFVLTQWIKRYQIITI